FAADLAETLRKADAGLAGLLEKIDAYIAANVEKPVPARGGIAPVACPPAPREVVFAEAGIRTVIWATGYERKFPWL
ncbi:MAG: pyridine nucleotide-disulfide oxidoreductase, partial [Gammaproteobacteria bacterium]|nr:pyridine nucleotide-disulfide oxidoreductase [Gammaproteobacteria bacterium]